MIKRDSYIVARFIGDRMANQKKEYDFDLYATSKLPIIAAATDAQCTMTSLGSKLAGK